MDSFNLNKSMAVLSALALTSDINKYISVSNSDETNKKEVNVPYRRVGERVSRNSKCPCGSGKKFKKCCLTKT